jgi:hypothetical protein
MLNIDLAVVVDNTSTLPVVAVFLPMNEAVAICASLPSVTALFVIYAVFPDEYTSPLRFAFVVTVAALPPMLTPARVNDPVPRFNGTAVVPMYTLLFPRTADGIVPPRLPAVREVRPVPTPVNDVAVTAPVDGLNENLVVEIFGATFPVVETHNG